MIKRIFITSLLSVILAAVCAAQSDPLNFVQTGTATHDMESDDLEAGHAILPIGQEVTVTNLESGAQATVTITERIPPTSSRIINLSGAAAVALAMFDDSTQVTIEAELKRTETPSSAAVPTPAATTTPADTTAPAAVSASVPLPPAVTGTPTAASTAPADAAATVPAPAEVSVAAVPVPYTVPPPPPGPIPTSEIEPIVPPWETGHPTPWPVQPSDPLLPELAQPWIGSIERPGINGPARIPAPPPRVASPPRAVPAPVYQGPSVSAAPHMPGPRDNTLYRVQVGAFKARANAQEAFNRLLNAGFSPVFEIQGDLTRVQIPWVRGYEMRALGERLYNAGFREVLLREER
ncbi:SPOR domain-containing protein [Treponema primitia]|uniref:RlpA-like double-psi beta-barrel domain-containing protein n=1 Tax=Treponema primitia TaxID=88058 RepID=UPI003980B229